MEQGCVVEGFGSARTCDIVPEYIDDIVSRITTCPRRLKVVIDPGNGVAGETAMAVCRRLGMDVSGICLEPDGTFPNHHPDPTTAEGIAMLKAEVLDKRRISASGSMETPIASGSSIRGESRLRRHDHHDPGQGYPEAQAGRKDHRRGEVLPGCSTMR